MKKTKLLIGFLPVVLWAQKSPPDSLSPKSKKIDEVILTGFQKIEKSKLTSAVEVVKMKDINQKATASIDQILQGKVAGVMINPSSGTPGQIAPIRIRGTASLTGSTDPLWVVDGMPLSGNEAPTFKAGQDINDLVNYSIAGFNPEDIESITVLKDASATAIYGARAANGVILVTTKKGKKGRMNINFSSNTFVNFRPNFSKLNLMNSNQKVDFELMMAARPDLDNYRKNNGTVSRILTENNDWDLLRNGGFGAISKASQEQINALRGINTDWGKLLYRTAVNQQHTVSISGGGNNHDYYASLGYYDEKSAVIGSGFERLNLTLKNDFKINEKLNIGVSLFGISTNTTSFLSDSGSYTTPTAYSRTANPYLRPFNTDGSYIYDTDINYIESLSGVDTRIPYNYMEEKNNTKYSLKGNSIRAIVDLDYKILKGLEFRSQLGALYDIQKTERYASENTYFMRKRIGNTYQHTTKSSFLPNGGYYNIINTHSFEHNWKNILEFNKKFNNHELNVLVGSEIYSTRTESQNSQMYGYDERTRKGKNFILPNSYENNSTYIPNKNTLVRHTFASFYGTLSYTYNNKYTLFGSIRYDGTDSFGIETKKRWNPIYAISGAWNAKNESFLKDNNTISMFKLRASYGLQGNYNRNVTSIFTGTYGNSKILNQVEDVILVNSAPNSKLRWEKTSTIDLGLDFGLWNNRINFTLELYRRKGTDLLGIKQLPLETGFSQTSINWAEVTNKGFEFSLSTVNIDRENFRWITTFNIARNKSNIDLIQEGLNKYYPSGQGYPINHIFGIRTAGLDQNGLLLFYDKNGNIVNTEEFYKLSDPWGIGYYTSDFTDEDYRKLFTYMGDRDPKYYGGITNTFEIGNWDFTVSASFNIKQKVQGNPIYKFTSIDRGLNTSAEVLNSWSPENTQTYLPRIIGSSTPNAQAAYYWFGSTDPSDSYNHLDIWMKEISYLRVNSIRLGYSLPKSLLHSTKINSMRLSVEGRNLFVVGSSYKGYFDPETYGNIYAQPIQKSIMFGINIGF